MLRKFFIFGIIFLTFPLTLAALSLTAPESENTISYFASTHSLPSELNVYENRDQNKLTLEPTDNAIRKILLNNNDYKGSPGCYLTCKSKIETKSSVAQTKYIYIYGQVRVAGKYKGRICTPTVNQKVNNQSAEFIETVCQNKFTLCTKNKCWTDSDSGKWFGMK